MNEPLTPSIELLKEIFNNTGAFEISFSNSDWVEWSVITSNDIGAWVNDRGVRVRRKQWTPEADKLIAVRETPDKPWSFGVFESISGGGYYVANGYRWNYARPVLPEELSK
jgi:predicted helicase